MPHAFFWLPQQYRLKAFGILFGAAAVIFAMLTWQGRRLRNPAANYGIVSFELSWNRAGAQSILDSWDRLQTTAKHQLVIDIFFLLTYPLTLGLLCAMLASSRFATIPTIGFFISWAVLFAMLFDATEDVALCIMLHRGGTEFIAHLATVCAGIKFTLIFAAVGYSLTQGIAILLRHPWST